MVLQEVLQRRREPWRWRVQWTAGESWQRRRAIIKLLLLQLQKVLKNSASTSLWSFSIWSKLESWKSSISGCFMSWLQIKKKSFWSVIFSYSTQQQTIFLLWLRYATKSGFHTTLGDNQLSGWTEKKLQSTSQSQTCIKIKGHGKSGGLLPVWSTIAFWTPVKPLYRRSMLSKLMRWTGNCNPCIWHWSTPRAQFFSTTMPNHMLHNQYFKSWTKWATKFCLIHHIHLKWKC